MELDEGYDRLVNLDINIGWCVLDVVNPVSVRM